ncbi:hypothetical protein P154DRAFT_519532 [Amniculicola lignicola CBS 123094]|uniref:Uncharacterized protein n=1 Tax=Amniculicola lignicola CBS 123094 TaxID=1392246 RepID=A0A6A5WUD0_9PLEO|nr:hypothetical protein P154DRAFT_519532 [Amniculicola lignicola CBS 123094]
MSITSLLNIIILFTAFGDCLKRWPIRSISDLDREIEVVKWIKKYTVPNTLNPQGAAWTVSQLPKISGRAYASNIKPAAWATAIVTA